MGELIQAPTVLNAGLTLAKSRCSGVNALFAREFI
jgi:hypothetical protein